MSALTNEQKRVLSELARRAWRHAAAQARGRGEDPAEDPLLREETGFRHGMVQLACGKAGLRCCSQEDYLPVKAHLLECLGRSGGAFEAHMKAASDGRRRAEWKLREACQEFGLNLNYADAICRRQHHGAGLAEVGEKALWHLVFTVRNRGRARRKRFSETTTKERIET
jgi:hypothetical protein